MPIATLLIKLKKMFTKQNTLIIIEIAYNAMEATIPTAIPLSGWKRMYYFGKMTKMLLSLYKVAISNQIPHRRIELKAVFFLISSIER